MWLFEPAPHCDMPGCPSISEYPGDDVPVLLIYNAVVRSSVCMLHPLQRLQDSINETLVIGM